MGEWPRCPRAKFAHGADTEGLAAWLRVVSIHGLLGLLMEVVGKTGSLKLSGYRGCS